MKKRWDWLASIIKKNNFKIGAEVGCSVGVTTSFLLRNCPGLFLYAVDLWECRASVLSDRAFEVLKNYDFDEITKLFNKRTRPYENRLKVLKGVSWEMAQYVDDCSLDFVFIDADHSYESVAKDIRAWTPKLKKGGILSGHDLLYEGVNRAVNELINIWVDTKVNQVWYCHKEDVK